MGRGPVISFDLIRRLNQKNSLVEMMDLKAGGGGADYSDENVLKNRSAGRSSGNVSVRHGLCRRCTEDALRFCLVTRELVAVVAPNQEGEKEFKINFCEALGISLPSSSESGKKGS